MYILTKSNNVIRDMSNTCEHDEEHRNYILDDYNIAYAPNEVINVYEVAEVPEGVIPDKYCYTEEDGFILNPDYVEPIPETTIEDLANDITDIQLAQTELAEMILSLMGGAE